MCAEGNADRTGEQRLKRTHHHPACEWAGLDYFDQRGSKGGVVRKEEAARLDTLAADPDELRIFERVGEWWWRVMHACGWHSSGGGRGRNKRRAGVARRGGEGDAVRRNPLLSIRTLSPGFSMNLR